MSARASDRRRRASPTGCDRAIDDALRRDDDEGFYATVAVLAATVLKIVSRTFL
jgi:hypothetical protein